MNRKFETFYVKYGAEEVKGTLKFLRLPGPARINRYQYTVKREEDGSIYRRRIISERKALAIVSKLRSQLNTFGLERTPFANNVVRDFLKLIKSFFLIADSTIFFAVCNYS